LTRVPPAASGGTDKKVIDFGASDTATDVPIQPDGKIAVAGEGATSPQDISIAPALSRPPPRSTPT
jgi:hypothetical protein